LYYYVSSKSELLFLIQQRCIERLLERLTMDLDGVDAATDQLAAVVRNHLSFFAKNLAEMKVSSREGGSLSAVHPQEIARLILALALKRCAVDR
jgi:AcrR family transcriptional regulator